MKKEIEYKVYKEQGIVVAIAKDCVYDAINKFNTKYVKTTSSYLHISFGSLFSTISFYPKARRNLQNSNGNSLEKQRGVTAGIRQSKRLHSYTNGLQTKERTRYTSYPQNSFVKTTSFVWKIWPSKI